MSDVLRNRWNDAEAAGLTEPELLRYRSNLLGADLRITNFGGGNTSAKVTEPDPLTGDDVTVLWVKGSGGDLGSMGLDGFATLYQDRFLSLERLYKGLEHEDAMVPLLKHCTFNLNPRAASIDTPLHAFVPKIHIDHLHPDAVIAIAASADGEALTKKVFEGQIAWVPWQRPGFDLGLQVRRAYEANPDIQGVVLGSHGLMTWADTSKSCYEISLEMIQRAAEFLARHEGVAFGGERVPARAAADRRAFATAFMPVLRGKVSRGERKVGQFADGDAVLEFVCSADAKRLSEIGTSCPDHFLRTKIWPMLLDLDGQATVESATAQLDEKIAAFEKRYRAYYQACRLSDSPDMRDPSPVVTLLPGIGMVTFAKDKPMARQSCEFFVNAFHVMKDAERVSRYMGLPDQEAFNIEYWQLEEAKLRRMPPEKSLSRRVALVTGAAGGIGRAITERLLSERACVVLTDIDAKALEAVHGELAEKHGRDFVRQVTMDVTDEASVIAAFDDMRVEYGGVDIVVCCAGLASSADYESTTLELWNRNFDVLARGYFLVSREGVRVMKQQGGGGSMVFIGSKNAMAASPKAAAYCSAKAAEVHLARCLALEVAGDGIRVNVVNPDAVLQGSKIWGGSWRSERAKAYGIAESELEEHYRQRSLLKRSVFPEDIAEAVYWLSTDAASKSTGNILNVDAGSAVAFPR